MIKYPNIEEIKKHNPCEEGLSYWLSATEAEKDRLWKDRPYWYLWLVGNCAAYGDWFQQPEVKERLDWCAEFEPYLALKYASNLLSVDRIDKCAEQRPYWALKYASNLLSADRIDKCAESEPVYALKYASSLLKADRLDWCKIYRR